MSTDQNWAELGRGRRQALAELGYAVGPRCLPDEPEACGGTFTDHVMAHLATIKAVADHHLTHLRPSAACYAEIYTHQQAELDAACKTCANQVTDDKLSGDVRSNRPKPCCSAAERRRRCPGHSRADLPVREAPACLARRRGADRPRQDGRRDRRRPRSLCGPYRVDLHKSDRYGIEIRARPLPCLR